MWGRNLILENCVGAGINFEGSRPSAFSTCVDE